MGVTWESLAWAPGTGRQGQVVAPGEAVPGADGTTCSPCALLGAASGVCSPGEDALLLLERSPCSTLCQGRPREPRRCVPRAPLWAWRWLSP